MAVEIRNIGNPAVQIEIARGTGGSGAPYDDTELRNRIENIENKNGSHAAPNMVWTSTPLGASFMSPEKEIFVGHNEPDDDFTLWVDTDETVPENKEVYVGAAEPEDENVKIWVDTTNGTHTEGNTDVLRNNIKFEEYSTEEFVISGVPIGTRSKQYLLKTFTQDEFDRVISIIFSYVNNSAGDLPLAFVSKSGTQLNLYVNFYSCTTSAHSNKATVRVVSLG